MKVCFDTCTIIDILGKTGDFFNSFVALDISLIKKFDPCCSVSSTTDIAYLMHSRGFAKTEQEASKSISDVLNLFTLISNDETDVINANISEMKDYEDALIANSAERANVDLIISRNKKDFQFSPVPCQTPAEFVESYKPKDYEYEMMSES